MFADWTEKGEGRHRDGADWSGNQKGLKLGYTGEKQQYTAICSEILGKFLYLFGPQFPQAGLGDPQSSFQLDYSLVLLM